MKRRKLVIAAGNIVLILALAAIPLMAACAKEAPAPAPAPAPTFTIKLSHESPPTHLKGIWAENFKKAVEEKSKGQIKVTLFHAGSLYSDPSEAIHAASEGLIQMSIASTGYAATMVPQYDVIALPFIIPDMETFYKLQDSDVGKELLSLLEPKGLIGIGYISSSPLQLFSKKPIVSIEDYKGQKIRAHTKVLESTLEALGASPTGMPASEMYLALEQGVIDGALTTLTYATPNHYWEVCDYVTLVRMGFICYPVVMNLKFWQSLPSDLQGVVEDAVAETINLNRAGLAEKTAEEIETLKANGMQVIELTPEQHQALVSKAETVYDQYKESIGEDFIKRVQAVGRS